MSERYGPDPLLLDRESAAWEADKRLTSPTTTTDITIADGTVIRPGDTIIISTNLAVTAEQAAYIKAQLMEECRGLANVLVVSGATVHTYRPATEDTP